MRICEEGDDDQQVGNGPSWTLPSGGFTPTLATAPAMTEISRSEIAWTKKYARAEIRPVEIRGAVVPGTAKVQTHPGWGIGVKLERRSRGSRTGRIGELSLQIGSGGALAVNLFSQLIDRPLL